MMTAPIVPWAFESPSGAHQHLLRRGAVTVAYSCQGRGPAVLFLQGAGLAGQAWRPQVNDLCRRFTTVTVDHRGVGGSSPAPGELTIEQMAEDALAVIDAEGIERFHVVGHGIGGLIAAHVAVAAPARVKSLALLCPPSGGAKAPRRSPGAVWRGLRARVGTRAMRRAGLLRLVMPRAYLQGVDVARLAGDLAALVGHDLADQPHIASRQLSAAARYDLTPHLRGLALIPALVASAAHDHLAPPRFGRALAARLAGRFVVFPHAGHALTIQCARGVNVTLTQHVAAVEGTAAGEPGRP
jgi:aminoacrylate hydrolase